MAAPYRRHDDHDHPQTATAQRQCNEDHRVAVAVLEAHYLTLDALIDKLIKERMQVGNQHKILTGKPVKERLF